MRDYEAQRQGQIRRWEAYYAANPNCPAGHPWTPENTRISTSPARRNGRSGRVCRQCERDKARLRRTAAKEAKV